MFFNFIDELRSAGIQASFKEHLVLLEALDKAARAMQDASRPEVAEPVSPPNQESPP